MRATWPKLSGPRCARVFASTSKHPSPTFPSERKPRIEFDAAVVGRPSATSATRATASEAGIHSGSFQELWRGDHTLISGRVEVVQHVGDIQADRQVEAML